MAADCEINFCLAKRDPNGLPINGINRVYTTKTSFTIDDKVKYSSQGGADAWDVERYLNIWVCDLSFGLLGYATPPSSNINNSFGVVIDYKNFGRVGNVSPPFDKGRTATHEIGHCFNLLHIWGDDGNSCSGSDLVNDTPNQADETYGCPNFPQISCNNGPSGDMFMNYMDYSNDACMNIFTKGQKDRMHAAINLYLSELLESDACVPVAALDAGVIGITEVTLCDTIYVPTVTIKNFGTDTLVQCTIQYGLNGNLIYDYVWTGSLPLTASETVVLPAIAVSPGIHTFSAQTLLPNGKFDENLVNDAFTISIKVDVDGTTIPLFEEFASGVFPPNDWQVVNPDNNYTWQFSNLGYNSSNSAYVRNYDYASNGAVDDLILPNLDLTAIPSPQLTFYVAYRLYTNPSNAINYSDTLEVLISTDCGASWQTIYKKWSTDLTTINPPYSSVEFKPSSPSHWRQELVSLAPFANSTNAILKFRNITDYENNLYIDKININFPLLTEEPPADPQPILFPNPTMGTLRLWIPGDPHEVALVRYTDVLGHVLFEQHVACGTMTELMFGGVPSGVGLLTVMHAAGTYVELLQVVR